MEATPSILLGTPDDFIERVRRLQEMGIDEVIWRIEGDVSGDELGIF